MGKGQPLRSVEHSEAARERAKAAAERAGLSVSQWLNQVISATSDHLDSTEKSLAREGNASSLRRLNQLRGRLDTISREIGLSGRRGSPVIELSLEEEVWELAEAVATLSERLAKSPDGDDFSWSSIDRQLGAIQHQIDHAARAPRQERGRRNTWGAATTPTLESTPVRPKSRYSMAPHERFDERHAAGRGSHGPHHRAETVSPRLLERLTEIEERLTHWTPTPRAAAPQQPPAFTHKAPVEPRSADPRHSEPRYGSRMAAIEQKLDSVIASFNPNAIADQMARETAKAANTSDQDIARFSTELHDIRAMVENAGTANKSEFQSLNDHVVQSASRIADTLEHMAERQTALETVYREGFSTSEIEQRLEHLAERVEDAMASRNPDISGLSQQLNEIHRLFESTPATLQPGFEAVTNAFHDAADRLGDSIHQLAERQSALEAAYRENNANQDLEDRLMELSDSVAKALNNPNGDIAALQSKITEMYTLIEASGQTYKPEFEAFQDRLDHLSRLVEDIASQRHETEATLEKRFDSLSAQLAHTFEANRPKLGELEQRLEGLADRLNERLDHEQSKVVEGRLEELTNRLEEAFAVVEGGRPTADDEALLAKMDEIADRLEQKVASRPMVEGSDADIIAHLDELADRIDQKVANNTVDLSGLDARLDALHQEIQASASAGVGGPEFSGIVNQLNALTDRVDMLRDAPSNAVDLSHFDQQIAGLSIRIEEAQKNFASFNGIDISVLDERLDALYQQLQSVPQSAGVGDNEFSAMVDQLNALTDRLDSMRDEPGSAADLSHIERQIAGLSDRIEEAQENFAGIHGIEKSLVDLFNRIDHVESSTVDAAKQAARDAILSVQPNGSGDMSGVIDAIQNHIAELQEKAESSDQRTRQSLGAIQTTLEKLVTRIQSLEAQPGGMQAAYASAVGLTAGTQENAPSKPKKARGGWFRRNKKSPVDEIDDGEFATEGDIDAHGTAGDPHLPLEPGMKTSALGTESLDAADEDYEEPKRSGAQLIDPPTRPKLAGDAKTQSAGNPQADFIAAARRAAQAAQQQQTFNAQADGPVAIEPEKPGILARSRTALLATVTAALFGVAAYMFVAPLISGGGDDDAVSVPSLDSPAPTSGQNSPAAQQINPVTDGIDAPASSSLAPSAVPTLPTAPQITNAVPEQISVTPPRQVYPTVQDGAVIETSSIPSLSAPLDTSSVITPSFAPPPALPTDQVPERLRSAALSGSPEAQFEVAVRYATGVGLERDLSQSAVWYERAAQQGMAPAQYRLGSLYEKGQGVTRDLQTAKSWYEKSAAGGNRKAMHNLAVLHAEGISGEPDYTQAATWFRQAAERNLADSQYNLAILFARGLGVERNMAESFKWFSIAATGGDKDADVKRAELEQQLDQETLLAARLAIQNWSPIAIDPAANDVTGPQGGWGPLPKTVTASAIGGPEPATNGNNQTVQRAQSLLNVLGYDPGPADGIIGPKTSQAIRAFERRIGKPETGQLSEELVRELAAAAS